MQRKSFLKASIALNTAVDQLLIREFKPHTEKTFEKGHRDQVFSAAFTKDGKQTVFARH